MKQGFEDAFSRVQSEYISLCLEYAEGKAEEIFAYVYRTETMRMFNVFYRSEGKILTASQIPTSCSDDELLEAGRNDISNLEKVCKEFEAEIPNELKMHYDVRTGKFDASVSYEDYSIKNKKTPMEVFMGWIKAERSK
ncbi:MAG: hypothetical protein J5685_07960 [Clostridiales bacterium]|nr:hypothetical protein [Clostridiales bacterium]